MLQIINNGQDFGVYVLVVLHCLANGHSPPNFVYSFKCGILGRKVNLLIECCDP